MTHISKHTCESAIHWNETASLINEKYNFVYYHELTPEPTILDAGRLPFLSSITSSLDIFFCTEERLILNATKGSPYILIKRTQLCLCLISARPYYL